MHWLSPLCCFVALLGVGAMVVQPAAADPVSAIVYSLPETHIVDDVEKNAAAMQVLQKGFAEKMAKLALKLPGWECVGVGASGQPKVELKFLAQRHPQELGDRRYLLTLSLFVSNKGREGLVAPGYADIQFSIDLDDPEFAEQAESDDPVIILKVWGSAHILPLMEKFKPCFVRSEIMAKATMHHQDQATVVNTETTMGPVELELKLDENGAFVAEGSSAMQFAGTIAPGQAILALRGLSPPPPPCLFETTKLSGQQPLTFSAVGSYRGDDGSLVYDSLTVAETGAGTLKATGGCAAGMVPPNVEGDMSGDLLGSGEHAQPMEDGAVLALPRADFMPPEVSWEGAVTLTYRPEVGSAPD